MNFALNSKIFSSCSEAFIEPQNPLEPVKFRELIIKLHDQYQHQQKVVILIDEYDKPILDNIVICVEFNRKDRNIVRFEYEKIDG